MAVVVFNCDYNGLSVIQALGRNGIKVYALDFVRSIGTYSKYCKYINIPNDCRDPEKFTDFLMNLRIDFKFKPLLFPTNDIWALVVSKNAHKLSSKYIIAASSYSTVGLLLDKVKFSSWCKTNDLLAPVVFDSKVDEIEYPVVLKALGRMNDSNKLLEINKYYDEFRMVICNNREEHQLLISNANLKNVKVFSQQLLIGDSSNMFTIGVCAVKGDLKGIFYGKKLRGFPPQYGDCVAGIALPVSIDIINLAKKVVQELDYTGIAEIELMRNNADNLDYIIEINPRSWSWIGITPKTGADLVNILYESIVLKNKLDLSVSQNNEKPVVYIKILQDIFNMFIWYRVLGYERWKISILAYLKELKSYEIVYAEFSLDDYKVGIMSIAFSMKRNLSLLKNYLLNKGPFKK